MYVCMYTTKIGWDGSTPTAGEVSTTPATLASNFGSSTACDLLTTQVNKLSSSTKLLSH